jgi:hypothetical protein
MKATHKGTCQVCGRQQMLPNDRLSKHGYTVEFGWFEGTCQGAGHLPYELSCDLVKESVVWAEDRMTDLDDSKIGVRKWTSESEVKAFVYLDYRQSRYGSGYRMMVGRIEERPDPWNRMRFGLVLTDDYGKEFFEIPNNGYCKTADELVQYLIDAEIRRIDRQIKRANKYRQIQQKRVDEWVARPENLVPVKR